MLERFRQRFGTAGLVVAVIALVAALGGTALAAKGALTGPQKKEVTKIAKKFAGQPGTNGTNGSPGAKGDTGAPGANGTDGSPGAPGKGVALTAITAAGLEGNCTGVGGTKVEVQETPASKKFICNGAKGTNGTTGFTETLPPGKTETGTYTLSMASNVATTPIAAISFPIPLTETGAEGNAWAFTPEQAEEEEWGKLESNTSKGCKPGETGCLDTGCRGNAVHPTAPSGTLCIYGDFDRRNGTVEGTYEARNFEFGFNAYSTSGAVVYGPFLGGTEKEAATIEAGGAWAVTAPTS
jgi:hypothetical protein